MTEEELSLRLKSAFPAAPPAGAALHARVEGKERDARRGIGRKRRGRAIFATLGAACVLMPVALRIPVMIVLYKWDHSESSKTVTRHVKIDPSPNIKNRLSEVTYSSSEGRTRVKSVYVDSASARIRAVDRCIQKGNDWVCWREKGKGKAGPTVVYDDRIPEKSWWRGSFQPPLCFREKDILERGRTLWVLSQNHHYDKGELGALIVYHRTAFDSETGKIAWSEFYQGLNGPPKRIMRSEYRYNEEMPEAFFKVPSDVEPEEIELTPLPKAKRKSLSEIWDDLLVGI